MNHDIES
jgi:jumonji domain-containing protein 7